MKLFTSQQLSSIAQQFGAPIWVYDAATIRARIAELKAFDVIRYAQKANSNTHILRLMREQGVKVDAVSLGELDRAAAAGYTLSSDSAEDVVFTADVLERPALARIVEQNVAVNAGSIDMLRQLGAASPGHKVWLRINPGFGHGHSNKTNTGGENSKHGIWHDDLSEALAVIRHYGLHLVGLHMHIGSGVEYGHLQQVCGSMVALAERVHALGHTIEAISAGGGLSIPYRAEDPRIDTAHYFRLWHEARNEIAQRMGHAVRLEIEPGRFLVAESGALVAEVRAVKQMGARHFVLLDAGFNDLMRPSLYGSYHEISVITPDGREKTGQIETVVAGPLCESGDVFTQQEGGIVDGRLLPAAQVGDWLVFHDAGAYGATMSSNYNSRPLLPEVLVDEGGARLIRRRQTMAELLSLEN